MRAGSFGWHETSRAMVQSRVKMFLMAIDDSNDFRITNIDKNLKKFCTIGKSSYLCSPKRKQPLFERFDDAALINIIDIMDLINLVEQSFSENKSASYPQFKAGDTITVTYRIKEGDKYRLQSFRGVVIQICGATPYTRTFTIRKISNGIGVERIFPYESPAIDKIELNKVGKVRRARIFYLRNLAGKKARIKEAKRVVKNPAE